MAIPDLEKERKRLAESYAGMTDGELRALAETGGSLTTVAREELRAEIARRRLDIAVAESPAVANRAEPSKVVMIRQFGSLQEAIVAKSVLDSAGIECFLGDENTMRMYWILSYTMGGVKLWVREDDAAAASALLDEHRPR